MEQIKGYTLIEEYDLKDIQSKGYLFKHDKSGARVAVVSNDDNNKVFSIGFRTPPKDSTGVAHIIEHTVLCGSRKFTAKDPFIELAKGSLNTFLNAMTYPDKTVYPVASCNDKDFANLMDVYLDSVFYPNIYNEEKIFMQEGWHYELENEDAQLKYNGVVYNEMKGAFSSPDEVLYRTISTALFPDTTYNTESGGDPEFIPELTYEQFLDFHRKYYHPSNSYIYLYGDIDVKERLEWMDSEYLCEFDYEEVDSKINIQEPFEQMRQFTKSYPVASDSEDEDRTYLSYSTSFGLSTDSELCIAFEVLSYVLVDAPGAPLKQKLLDLGYGRDIFSDFEAEIRQPYFSIIAKDSNEKYKDDFVKVIKEELTRQVNEGFDDNSIAAALAKLEFKYREADYDSYPKGLIFGLDMFAGWLYDDSLPFTTLQLNSVYDSLREKIGTGYFEELVRKYLIDNTHCALVVVSPDKELGKIEDEKLEKKLDAYKKSLTLEQISEIVKNTRQLKEYQEAGSTPEQLATIPQLKRTDISRDPLPINNTKINISGTDVIWHDIYTNNIAYVNFYFNMKDVPLEFIPYVGLYTTSLGYFNTTKKSYFELANLANLYTGGVEFNAISLSKSDDVDDNDYMLKVSVRFLYHYCDDALGLINEVLTDTIFDDEKHLREVIRECTSRMSTKLSSASHTIAVKRADSYYCQAGMFSELTSGISYYDFLVDADSHFDEKKSTIIEIFNILTKLIFKKENAIVNLTCDEKGKDMLTGKLDSFLNELSAQNREINVEERVKSVIDNIDNSFVDLSDKDNKKFKTVQKNEGFKFAGQVQYVARTGNYRDEDSLEYNGALAVLKTVLGYGYLWDKVRVTGGAYGCMVNFSKNGAGFFVSYRDPNLAQTNDVFKSVPEFIENFEENEQEMTKYVIGTIGRLDTPMNPNAKGLRDFALYYSQTTYEELVKARHQIIDVETKDIRELAPYVKKVLDMENICVIGNEKIVEDNKELFNEVKNLI